MATSQEMKKLSVPRRELILQQEVNLKVAVSLFQVWKNIIRFLLLMASGVSENEKETRTKVCKSLTELLPFIPLRFNNLLVNDSNLGTRLIHTLSRLK